MIYYDYTDPDLTETEQLRQATEIAHSVQRLKEFISVCDVPASTHLRGEYYPVKAQSFMNLFRKIRDKESCRI